MNEFVWVRYDNIRAFREQNPTARCVVFLTKRENETGMWEGYYREVNENE